MQKVVLITGGLRGIGEAISERFLKENYQVVIIDRDVEKRHTESDECHAVKPGAVEAIACDVGDHEQCQAVVASILKRYNQIDVLVNNAGITRDTTFKRMDKAQWDDVLRVNLSSLFNVTRPVIESMLDHRSGRIINMSSVNGIKGQFGQTNYSAAKAGVHGFTKALAQEVASKGITVNTISPGYINTEMMKAIPEDILKNIQMQIPAGRLGEPDEIAALAFYLASDDAAFITGANISINGGQHMC